VNQSAPTRRRRCQSAERRLPRQRKCTSIPRRGCGTARWARIGAVTGTRPLWDARHGHLGSRNTADGRYKAAASIRHQTAVHPERGRRGTWTRRKSAKKTFARDFQAETAGFLNNYKNEQQTLGQLDAATKRYQHIMSISPLAPPYGAEGDHLEPDSRTLISSELAYLQRTIIQHERRVLQNCCDRWRH